MRGTGDIIVAAFANRVICDSGAVRTPPGPFIDYFAESTGICGTRAAPEGS